MNLTEAYAALKFCPLCSHRLMRHPLSGEKMCYQHGRFVVTGDAEQSRVEFVISVRKRRAW